MHLRILLAVLLALFAGQAALAHQDRIIRLNGEKLEGLPPQYQPATFSLKERRIAVGAVSVVVPECLWKQFGAVKAADLSFQSSWYHDPRNLPPYLLISIGKTPGKTAYQLLLNLDTLAVISFRKGMIDAEGGGEYEDTPLDAACAAQWKVVRKP